MKYGLFSDVHANLEAFQSVIDALRKEKVDRYVFLGDIVGYGADPKKCIELLKSLIKEHHCQCVAGNHDYAVCDLTSAENYNQSAREAIEWTKAQLDKGDMEFLAQLPLVERIDNFTIVHANLISPKDWAYIFDIDDASPNFKLCADPVCFIGHSHKSIIFKAKDSMDWLVTDKVNIEDDTKYIINIGSVGQPRDGNPKSSFAVYDTENARVEIHRIGYDISAAQEKIINAGLPKILASRLSSGD